jgi:ABC-type antimicrobial peptide transport system permease subunit
MQQDVGEYQWWVAAIALITAGIGITNSMFLSVSERIKEIGVLKTSGGTFSQILLLFEFEAAIYGFIGGISGCIGGIIFSLVVNANNFKFLTSNAIEELIIVIIDQTILLVMFATLFTILASLFPAIRGARHDLARSLTYEV